MARTAIKRCECGCGKPVRRHFLPGHDARLKGQLLEQALSGDGRKRRPAMRELKARGWMKFLRRHVEAA